MTQRTNTILTIAFISDLIDKEPKAMQAVTDFKTRLGNDLGMWSDQAFCLGDGPGPQRCCSYHQGKLVFDIASMFFGVGEVSAGLKGFKLGSFVEGKLATQMGGLLSKIKVPTGLIMKPIRKVGLAIGTAVMVASTDPAMVIKPFANGIEMLAARTTGKASAEAIQKASLLLEEGTTKTISEAVGSLDNMALKLTD